MKSVLVALLVCLCATYVMGDCYMQNPRGSNDRLNEANADRNNANRLFDSQNNDRGGYCTNVPSLPMTFYTGSILPIEWTAQHACGSNSIQCNIVFQYMCSDDNGDETNIIRDGTTTNTIPNNADTYNTKDPVTGAFVFGMHENYAYYQACRTRSRNKGLFTADQTMDGRNAAIFTRQDNNGNQYGFECPEERDYYPYWHPAPWKDIAVLVDSTKQCDFFQQNSQNVQAKNYCTGTATGQQNPNQQNNKQDCLSNGGQWNSQPAWGIAAPDCQQAPWNRDNHLGNGVNGFTSSYNWTLPTSEPCLSGVCSCVLRIRYNISTPHTLNWGPFADSASNGANSPVKGDPYIMIGDQNVSIALNTDQYGRTFQDRSFVFNLANRPNNVGAAAKIYNLNVRGKRGNIVQTYPATEYDFVPQNLHVTVGDYIHMQWTGCDNNPANNAGEGTAQTDKSNIVQIQDYGYHLPLKDSDFADKNIPPLFEDQSVRLRFAHLDQVNCLSYDDLKTKYPNNQNGMDTDPQNCMKLNAASAYFNGGLVKMNNTGQFYYMSSRNNNFSNRTQKAMIQVDPVLQPWAIALIVIGGVTVGAAAALGGSVFYAKKHPHSGVASFVSRIPGINRI